VTTFPQSRKDLRENEALSSRICHALGIEKETTSTDQIWDKVWPHLNSFHIAKEAYTRWYMMDEVGLALSHSDTPNMRCCPLFVIPTGNQASYSLSVAWPCRDISAGEVLSRDYRHGLHVDSPNNILWNLGFHYQINLINDCERVLNFLQTFESSSSLQSVVKSKLSSSPEPPLPASLQQKLSDRQQIRVFCDRSDHLNAGYLTHDDRIKLVSSAEEADVLYLIDHLIDSDLAVNGQPAEYSKANKLTSQFCWNNLVITKEALAKTVRTAHRSLHHPSSVKAYPSWFPESFDLTQHDELIAFLRSYFRSSGDVRGYWILKRHTGKQSMDYPISNNLSCLLRHAELDSRIASRYINEPLLLDGRKFDLRYHVLVSSLEPLDVKRHEIFVIRWANHRYRATDYEDYQTHFTVMNFLEEGDKGSNALALAEIRGLGQRQNIHPDDFIRLFDEEYREQGVMWSSIQQLIDQVLRQLFEYVQEAFYYDESMVGNHPNAYWTMSQAKNIAAARAMYGVDIILDATYQPYVLEVQWAPDCTRAIDLRPTFWDEILAGLYLHENRASVKL
jgi:tubulin--tyrosine ligase-like protein 12